MLDAKARRGPLEGGPSAEPDDESSATPAWKRLARFGSGRRDVDPLFRMLVENARDLIFRYRFGPKPGFEYVSPAARPMTGYSPSEFYAHPEILDGIIHPADRDGFRTVLKSTSARARPITLRWIRKDGGVLWVETRFESYLDKDGNLVAIEGFARNVSEHHHAEEAVQRSAQLLEEAQRIAHLGSWEWDTHKDVVAWSAEMFTMYGQDPETFAASREATLERVDPQDRTTLAAALEKAAKEGKSFDLVHRILRPDGTVRRIHTLGRPARDDSARPGRVVGTAQDVTDTLAAQERFEALLEAAPDGIVIADDRGTIEFANQAAERLSGYSRMELVGQPIEIFLADLMRERHQEPRGRNNADPQKRPMGFGMDLRAIRKDGSEFPCEVSLSPATVGEKRYLIAAVRDVTERKILETERERASERIREVERLKQMDELKSDFIAMAAHELGNPITPIQLQLHLLKGQNEKLTADQRSSLRILDRNVKRMASLIGDLLEAARHQSGRVGISRERVHLRELARESIESLAEVARDKGITLTLDAETDFVAPVDAKRIAEVIDNLISNSIKFTPPGGSVRVKVRQDGEMAYVSVQDTGIGIDPDKAAQLFRPFSRIHRPEDAAAGGSGLGLYICKALLELHDGRIWATSPGRGQGTTMAFTIPLKANAAIADQQPLDILLVEDNAADVVLAREALNDTHLPITLHVVRDGEEALSYLRNEGSFGESKTPDLMLLDLNLPRLSGHEVMATIRGEKTLENIPVVMLTASDAESDKIQSYDNEAAGYLTKPLEPDKVLFLLDALRLR